MNPEGIQGLCITGTDAYLAFLSEKERGLDSIDVTSLRRESKTPQQEKSVFRLELGGPLFDPDCISLELTPPRQTYGPEYFRVLKYDSENKILIIQVQKPELSLDGRSPESIRIISDLRFLVRNVKAWFASNGGKLQLPRRSSGIHEPTCVGTSSQHSVVLEPCQATAVSAALGNPLTYVWGPPGTGKTRHMLTAAILELLLADKRVGLFAPTNNALEQAMTAVLHAAHAAGIDREKFLRVGHPSSKFVKDFPEVCEIQGVERQLSRLREQIGIYTRVLHWRRGATVLNSAATLRHEAGRLRSLLEERRKLYVDLGRLRRNSLSKVIHRLDGSIRVMTDKLASLEDEIRGQLEIIKHTHTESPPLNAIIQRVNFTNVEQTEADVVHLAKAVHEYLDVNRALAEAYNGQTDEHILKLIADLEQEVKRIEEQAITERIRSAPLIGMTLDCFIGRFHEISLSLDHIFLDEAGYAPLIKALTLCRGGVPLTFVGDHKQLGPVSEMDGHNLNSPKNAPAILWKQSALFLDEVFLADNRDGLTAQLLTANEPKGSSFLRIALNKTFRFGQKLADVLSTCVYHDVGLIAAGHHGDLDIVCLNAIPSEKAQQRRENPAEADCIASYIRTHPELDGDGEETYAILTPYKRQVSLLRKRLPEACRQGRIMTVHRAQGREWHTIFFSVVDGRLNRPWFTDTMNLQSGGLHVVNTAVSRARKRLVIVCDMDYWTKPSAERQLISRLLGVAD